MFMTGIEHLLMHILPGAAIGVLGVPLQMALEDPRAVDGRVNIAKHV